MLPRITILIFLAAFVRQGLSCFATGVKQNDPGLAASRANDQGGKERTRQYVRELEDTNERLKGDCVNCKSECDFEIGTTCRWRTPGGPSEDGAPDPGFQPPVSFSENENIPLPNPAGQQAPGTGSIPGLENGIPGLGNGGGGNDFTGLAGLGRRRKRQLGPLAGLGQGSGESGESGESPDLFDQFLNPDERGPQGPGGQGPPASFRAAGPRFKAGPRGGIPRPPPNGGAKYAAATVRGGQVAAMRAQANFLDQGHYILFAVYESTRDIQLKVCCDTEEQCTSWSSKDDEPQWEFLSAYCPRGTQEVVFVCENMGGQMGACGLDSIRLFDASGEDACSFLDQTKFIGPNDELVKPDHYSSTINPELIREGAELIGGLSGKRK